MAGKTAVPFIPGDLVISVYGDGDGSGDYTDNQASAIVLEQLTTTGSFVSQMVLPQSASTNAAGVSENPISGEYGSSSEGTLELSGDGHSLVIAGYDINAATYNQGGAAVYGNAALAQSTSVLGGQYTAVARVIADIGADGTVDTSTALYNVFNTNNPRSVATVDGSSFYISGQGVSGDTTQGLFEVQDGAASATRIDGSTDTRTAEIYNGELYVSRDSKQPKSTGTSNISAYGTGLPTTATTPVVLSGISQSIHLTAAEENSVNASDVGKGVDLSPENFFFANPDTLYVADGGNPKEGTLGDGGLQKWSFSGSTWTLDYTLSNGLNLVANTASSGTTGLIGLTGKVVGDSVQLYATNAAIGDLDPTYLYGITDSLSATTGAGESFTTLMTAAPDTNIRGVAFAPTEAGVTCFCRGTRIRTDRGDVPVEHLRAGDIAITRVDGADAPSRIIWVGRRRIDIDRHPHPERARPVRIAPGALADGVPARPLLLSPDHALLLDGVLVAGRQLLNGGSITVVQTQSVEYFHVELQRHGILLAEGAEAESYLDTGNRHHFEGAAGISLHADFSRAEHPPACVRLATDAVTVQPLWQRIADRAAASGHRIAEPITTREPDLCLILPDGAILHPRRFAADRRYLFWLDTPHASPLMVRLQSRHNAPAEIHPWLDDRRQLGVAVGGIELWTRSAGLISSGIALDDAALHGGWWTAEGSGTSPSRWTDGDAALLLPAGCCRLDVSLVATAEYLCEATLIQAASEPSHLSAVPGRRSTPTASASPPSAFAPRRQQPVRLAARS